MGIIQIEKEMLDKALTVTGIGKVYDQIIRVKDEAEIKTKATSGGHINIFMFTEDRVDIEDDESLSYECEYKKRRWLFYLRYSYNDKVNSDKAVRHLAENIITAFNKDATFNKTVVSSTKMGFVKRLGEYAGVLVHEVDFEMTTTEIVNNT